MPVLGLTCYNLAAPCADIFNHRGSDCDYHILKPDSCVVLFLPVIAQPARKSIQFLNGSTGTEVPPINCVESYKPVKSFQLACNGW